MNIPKKLSWEKILLILSGTALIFFTTPAWFKGFAAAALACVLMAAVVWKLPEQWLPVKNLPQRHGVLSVAILVLGAYGFNFYNMWMDSGYMARIAGLLNVDVSTFVLILAAVLAAASLPFVAMTVSWAADSFRTDYRELSMKPAQPGNLPFGKSFALLLAVFVLGISALIRADFLYQDDAGRAVFGYKQWDYFGRFFSTAFASLVHAGDYLVDVAPLPQLLAMAIAALSGVLVLCIVYERTDFSVWEILAVSVIGLNPYFLECVSFRFDAPYMAASVLGGIVPLLFRKKSTVGYLFAAMVGTLVVCTSYQAATGIFPMLVILIALRMWCGGESMKNTAIFCAKSVGGYGLGLLYFKAVLMRPAYAGYVSNEIPSDMGMIENTLQNLKQYYLLIAGDFKLFWLILVAVLMVCFLAVMVRKSRRAAAATIAMTVFALSMMLLLCFGVYPVLKDTLFAPRAMYGFGAFLALLCVITAEGSTRMTVKLPALLLAWIFVVFAFTYGNALNYQREYTDFRIELVVDDLEDMDVFRQEEPVCVKVAGNIGKAPMIRNMPQNYQMMNRLIPSTFAGSGDLTLIRFYKHYDLRNVAESQKMEFDPQEMTVLKDGMYHSIYRNDDGVLIVLK